MKGATPTLYGKRHAKWLAQFPDETIWNAPAFPTNPTSGYRFVRRNNCILQSPGKHAKL